MFKCKEKEDADMLQEYLEELNKNDITHLPELLSIAECEKRIISHSQSHMFSPIDFKCFSMFQNVDEAESFVKLFGNLYERYIYKNYPYSQNCLKDLSSIYDKNQFDRVLKYWDAMLDNDIYFISYFEGEELEYEVNYEEDTTTVNALTYPYQLFL